MPHAHTISSTAATAARTDNHSSSRAEARTLTEAERRILDSLHDIRFGSVEIVIHDSRIVQIQRSEKLRFDAKGNTLSDSLS